MTEIDIAKLKRFKNLKKDFALLPADGLMLAFADYISEDFVLKGNVIQNMENCSSDLLYNRLLENTSKNHSLKEPVFVDYLILNPK